ncbi:hypothetical protein B8W69_08480 [Mycobacterium vulneris]|uniref:Uncharacterized protein n=1 Tax=Mycolicibacterium vulneris TaxID=547163 RepID=A0A1X2L6R2_9MYCO|nr:hypothetical protein B8W69_08480 [Mycolicibacterium vulneris]
MGADWIFRMRPSDRQTSRYELKPQFLPPHFALFGDRFYEVFLILICDPDNQITVRMPSMKFTHLRDCPEEFLFLQEQIAYVIEELALFQHRLGEWTMSFSAVALDKEIKVLLYYPHAVIRVMAQFSENVVRSSFHCRTSPKGKTRHSRPTGTPLTLIARDHARSWQCVNPSKSKQFNRAPRRALAKSDMWRAVLLPSLARHRRWCLCVRARPSRRCSTRRRAD